MSIRRGLDAGQRANTRLRDILTGRFFLSHNSHGDDAARQLEALRDELKNGSRDQEQSWDELARAISRLNANLAKDCPAKAPATAKNPGPEDRADRRP